MSRHPRVLKIWTSRTCVLLLVAVLLTTATGCSQAPSKRAPAAPSAEPARTAAEVLEDVTQQVQELADSSVEVGQAPGVIALVRIGDDVRVMTAGLADVGAKKPMTAAHRFPIASVTKSMVAALVMQLVEKGTLSLGDSVGDWLPGALPSGEAITIDQLLSHRSGLPDYLAAEGFQEALRHNRFHPQALVRLISAEDLEFAPGTATEYSNTNYLVLGLIIEAATGATLAQNLDTGIFEPAGMSATALRPNRVAEEPLVHGYADGKDVTTSRLVQSGWADGGVLSTVKDVSRFYRSLLSGDMVRPDLVKRMTTVTGDVDWASYGRGIAVTDTQCGTSYGHQGRELGFFTDAWTLEGGDREVVVTVNVGEDVRSSGPIKPIVYAALCG